MGSSFPSQSGTWLRAIHPEFFEGTFGAQFGCEIRMGGKATLSNSDARAYRGIFSIFSASSCTFCHLQVIYLFSACDSHTCQLERENRANSQSGNIEGFYVHRGREGLASLRDLITSFHCTAKRRLHVNVAIWSFLACLHGQRRF